MGVVAEIEKRLCELRAVEDDGVPELRTSTMTHIVWCPPRWRAQARATLAGLDERHPARTIFLVPVPGRAPRIEARVEIREFELEEAQREVVSEVIEIRLAGAAVHHPGSIVLPLLVSDLPVFCRWRGEPAWESPELQQIAALADRLVVDSAEWSAPVRGYGRLEELFDHVAVSDIAFARTLAWRRRLAELWPGIGSIERLRVEGPHAEAELLAGWLRSRLRRQVSLSRRGAAQIRAVWIDGERVEVAGSIASASDLLSAELDLLGRDPVYEAAVVRAVSP